MAKYYVEKHHLPYQTWDILTVSRDALRYMRFVIMSRPSAEIIKEIQRDIIVLKTGTRTENLEIIKKWALKGLDAEMDTLQKEINSNRN